MTDSYVRYFLKTATNSGHMIELRAGPKFEALKMRHDKNCKGRPLAHAWMKTEETKENGD